ncbi:serine hydrolase domain-containing protein [Erwinia tasmaniensis]|uniref:serine hydrolase domain-containing protein n=1 Tax=Erwinia tasmaniensis TaxID=338565 RepID=UPI003A4E6133
MTLSETRLQTLLNRITAEDFPGIAVAVGKGNNIIWQGTAGYADMTREVNITPETRFGIGSITKVFIAVIILQLTEEGLLTLDAPLSRWLEKACLAGIANADKVTLRQLLSHRAGIPSWENEPSWIHAARGKSLDPTKIWQPDENLAYIRGIAPLCRPGEAFHYSNTHFTLLGLLIERITLQGLREVLATRIFNRLALANTFMVFDPQTDSQGMSGKFHRADDSFIKKAGFADCFKRENKNLLNVSATNLTVEWAAGGIISTSQDVLTFILALKNGQLLNAASLNEMQNWIPADGAQMGLSLFRMNTTLGMASGHGGNVLGFSASVWWYEKTDCAVAILTNVGTMHAHPSASCASTLFREGKITKLAQEMCALH